MVDSIYLAAEEPQIRKIMPTLVSICGGAEQAAYAIVWRPELLELEAASALRDSLQVRSCVLFFRVREWVSLQVRLHNPTHVVCFLYLARVDDQGRIKMD